MSLILNIETATPVCSICISKDGQALLTKEILKGQSHAEKLTLLIEEAAKELQISLKELSAVAVSNGPGSYTGLRIGLSVAKGICYALNKPLITLSSLKAIAWGAYRHINRYDVLYCPMIDARRMEVYTTLYDFRQETPLIPIQAKILDEQSFQDFFEQGYSIVFSGNGAVKCQAIVNNASVIYEKMGSSASFLPELSHNAYICETFSDLSYVSPSYLKKPNITKGRKKL